jgi:hypothetical protein
METGCARRVLTAVILRPIRYVDILDSPEAEDLLREYSAECSIPEIGPTSPQRDIYARMEASGLMHSFGVYDGRALVGFATLLVFVLPHYGKKIANVESLFLAKSHRGALGRWLMAEIENVAKRMQCAGVLYNARTGSRLEKFLTAVPQYQRTNSVFLRTL